MHTRFKMPVWFAYTSEARTDFVSVVTFCHSPICSPLDGGGRLKFEAEPRQLVLELRYVQLCKK